jgi:type 1 glutamine amidotransferase
MRGSAVSGFTVVITFILCVSCYRGLDTKSEKLNILILTGRNNHDWEMTTAVLDSILEAQGLFSVDVTTQPDTLRFEDLKHYDALLSNWNSWPENDLRWPAAAEKGLLRFVHEGGGLVFFHSSTSAFYTWPEFKQISTAAWIMDSTWHGPVSQVKVSILNREHPVTSGITDFYIMDELWINAGQNEVFKILATAADTEENTGEQPAIFVGNYGKGRIFHTILGHNETSLRNEGFQMLILRAAEWASTGRVSIPVSEQMSIELVGKNIESLPSLSNILIVLKYRFIKTSSFHFY